MAYVPQIGMFKSGRYKDSKPLIGSRFNKKVEGNALFVVVLKQFADGDAVVEEVLRSAIGVINGG